MNKNNNNKFGMHGLPSEIKYCIKCNISNQQPTSTNEYKHDHNTIQIPIEFDSNNVWYACRVNEKKWNSKIDWKERERELKYFCEKYKNFKGQYNCLIGGSGGKDSAFQSHILKYKYGMRPLTVTWSPSPYLYTDIGMESLLKNWTKLNIQIPGYKV